MSDDKGAPVPSVNVLHDILGVSGLSRLGETLFFGIFRGLGEVYRDSTIRTRANRQADANLALSKAETDAVAYRMERLAAAAEDVKTIEGRAMIEEHYARVVQQRNLERIAAFAIENGERLEQQGGPVEPTLPDDEWMDEFREVGRRASREELQRILGRILSEETVSPHSYPISVLTKLRSIDRETLEKFSKFAAFYMADAGIIDVFSSDIVGGSFRNDLAQRFGLYFGDVLDLSNEGLMESQAGLTMMPPIDQKMSLRYIDHVVHFTRHSPFASIPIVPFSKVGRSIAPLLARKVEPDYLAAVLALRGEGQLSVEVD